MSNSGNMRREVVLAICCMSILIVGLDVTILNVALPAIQDEFGASVSGAQWTIDAYTLVIACFLMLAGSTGDRLGRRRTFQVGLVTFTIGSALCSVAPGLGWLIAFRMIQAIGGAMLNPVALSIVTNVFTEPRDRAWVNPSPISTPLTDWMDINAVASRPSSLRSHCTWLPRPGGTPAATTSKTPPSVSPAWDVSRIASFIRGSASASAHDRSDARARARITSSGS